MAARLRLLSSEALKRKSLLQRMIFVHGVFLFLVLLIVARLMELQIVRGAEYRQIAQERHFGNVQLPAKRGEIFALNSKTGERNILATNTTLDLVYVDPLVTDDPTAVAETLADILITPDVQTACVQGSKECPPELIALLYSAAFDPIERQKILAGTGVLLEPVPADGIIPPATLKLPDLVEARRLFARSIEERIKSKRVTFSPLKYGATKVQMQQVAALALPGITVLTDQSLIYANPEEVNQAALDSTSARIAHALEIDVESAKNLLRARPLRYVPIMRKITPAMSLAIKEAQLASLQKAQAARLAEQALKKTETEFTYPLRSIALIAENWRYYPDTTIASHVVGFLNSNQEAQYGIERAFNPQLQGEAGVISSVKDLAGGQILTPEQTIIKPKDGDSIVLTIDRTIQKEVETILAEAVKKYNADDAQAIVMDPYTGRVLAMVNAPLFDSNDYASVYEKQTVKMDDNAIAHIEVELYNPDTNVRELKANYPEVFTASGRLLLTPPQRATVQQLEKLYDLKNITRYYLFVGENDRREIFPTDDPHTWMKFQNGLGVGAYLNRDVQSIYEPGSVMKPITMAIAIDQGELTPNDTYLDNGIVQFDEYKIDNALHKHYGLVTMTQCLQFSINTCMTSVSTKLGAKLFSTMLRRFGFGSITGIELEDELAGEVKPWHSRKDWSTVLLATAAFGQGVSVTPIQMATAFGALANGGKLMRPTIIDRIIHADGTEEVTQPKVVDQVITKQTADTVTAMLISSVDQGYALKGGVRGYFIAGKTGTSQIASPRGGYVSGTGSTITSFIGYAPARHPKFLVYVKFDRPTRDFFGSSTAVPVFHDISAFLFQYYGLPPDR